MVVGIEKVILHQHLELRIGYISKIVTGKLILEKNPYAIAEAAKPLVPYFEVLHVGFVKRPCDANLEFCSLWIEWKLEKTEPGLLCL